MTNIDFSKYDFTNLKNGKVEQKAIKNKEQLKDYLINLIRCDFENNVKLSGENIHFQVGAERFVLTIT